MGGRKKFDAFERYAEMRREDRNLIVGTAWIFGSTAVATILYFALDYDVACEGWLYDGHPPTGPSNLCHRFGAIVSFAIAAAPGIVIVAVASLFKKR